MAPSSLTPSRSDPPHVGRCRDVDKRHERARSAASISSRCSPRCSPRAGLIGLSGSPGQSRSRGSLAASASVSSATRRANRAAARGAIAWIRDGSSRSASHHRARRRLPPTARRDRSSRPGPGSGRPSRRGDRAPLPRSRTRSRARERIVVQRLDEGSQALPLLRIRFDVRSILTHGMTILPGGDVRAATAAAISPMGREMPVLTAARPAHRRTRRRRSARSSGSRIISFCGSASRAMFEYVADRRRVCGASRRSVHGSASMS